MDLPGEPLPVLVSLPERTRQRRWTVLIRWILAIPLYVVLVVIAIATAVVVLIGWFGALFTGRTPTFARTLVTGYLRISLRLWAYGMLVTDRFPPFSLTAADDYPVQLAIPEATRMNRWSVLFRIILVIPVTLLAAFVQFGLGVFIFFMWLVTLVTGWLPIPVHDAYRAFLRYQTRVNAFFYLLVPAYPRGLFGDRATTEHFMPVPDAGVTPPGAEEPPPLPSQPKWNLFLGKGAKRVLVVAIVLGVPAYIGSITLDVALRSHSRAVAANNLLVSDLNQFQSVQQACEASTGKVACLEQANHVLGQQLLILADQLDGVSATGANLSAILQVQSAARTAASDLTAVSNAGPTMSDLQNSIALSGVNDDLSALVQAQNQLHDQLVQSPF
jgi:hypothetical protein